MRLSNVRGASLETQTLLRLAALAAIAGGVMRVVSAFTPYVPGSAALEGLYAAIDLLLLFGTIGIYVAEAPRLRPAGLIGFMLTIAGLASIVGPDGEAFGLNVYQIGVGVIAIGLLVLSVQFLRAGTQRLAAAFWLISVAFGVAGEAVLGPEQAFAAAGLAFGLGYVGAGWALWQAPLQHRAKAAI